MKQLYFLLLLFVPSALFARGDSLLRNSPSFIKFGTSVTGDLSHTGYSNAWLFTVARGRLVLSAGPKVVLSEAYTLRAAPYGLVTGFSFYPVKQHRFAGFINADYQLTLPGNCGGAGCGNFDNLVHEYTAGYGFAYSFTSQLQLLSSINIGRYTEKLHDPWQERTIRFSGYNTLLRLGVNYMFRP